MDEIRRKRYVLAVYSLLLAVAIILALVGINYLREPVQGLVLSLATELAGVVLIFFVVNRLFLLGREDDTVEQIQSLRREANLKFNPLVSGEEGRRRLAFADRIQSAQTVDLLGYALSGFMKEFEDPVIQAIYRGARVRILLVDIRSEAGRLIRDHAAKPAIEDIEGSLGHSRVVDMVRRVKEKSGVKGSLEFRLVTWIPSCIMLIVNREQGDGAAYIGITPPFRREPRTVRRGLSLTRADHAGDFQYFVDQFESLWRDDSYTLEERDQATVTGEHDIDVLSVRDGQVEEFRSIRDWAEAIAERLLTAGRIKDLSWGDEEKLRSELPGEAYQALEAYDAAAAEVRRKDEVVYHEILVPNARRLAQLKTTLEDQDAAGYSVRYLPPSMCEGLPHIGGFVLVDPDTEDGQLFIAGSRSAIWLRVKHLALVRYFSKYFDDLWSRAQRYSLKDGPDVFKDRLEQLVTDFGSRESEE